MKALLILLLTIHFICKAQYPISKTLPSISVDTFPVYKMMVLKFKDTLEANKSPIRFYEDAIIMVADTIVFIRSKCKWIEIKKGGGDIIPFGSVAPLFTTPSTNKTTTPSLSLPKKQ